MTSRLRLGIVRILVLSMAAGASGLQAQNVAEASPETDQASGSYAIRGLTIGAITGGAVGGIGIGLLASALCESSDCDGQFLSGALVGGGLGALAGGTVGLVIGALIPRGPPSVPGETPSSDDPTAPDAGAAAQPTDARRADAERPRAAGGSPFRVGISFGPARGSGEPNAQTDVSVAVTFLANRRPPTNVGFELTYLGTRSMTFSRPDGGNGTITTTLKDRLWGGSVLTTRRVLGGPRGGGYLLASAGGYLEESSRTILRGPDPPDTRTESDLRPGLGAGLGGSWATWDRVGLGFEGRAHVVFGAGDGILTLWTLGGTLWFLR